MSASAWVDAASRRLMALVVALSATALVGCASAPARPGPSGATGAAPAAEQPMTPPSPADPWEAFNRRIFGFNEFVDRVTLKPLAELYQAALPYWLRTGIDNLSGNLGEVWSAVNHLLQGKAAAALDTGLRFGMNTVFGLGGFFDVASEAGIERRSEDFGQTLGVWGLKPGPFLMLPLLGPSTLRDAGALSIDMQADSPRLVLSEEGEANAATALRLLNTRAKLLRAGQLLDDIALDKYVLIRDGYLSRRRSLVYDGNPPDEDPPPPAAGGTPQR